MIGNGTMTRGGGAKQASLLLSGAGAVDAGKLAVGDLKSDSEGAGDHLFNATKSATITARGVGRTVVLGRPVCTVRNVGSGTVDCGTRSEEHTSELQSLMRISYAVFCLKKKTKTIKYYSHSNIMII